MDCRRRRRRCGGEALPKDTIPPTHANGDTNTRYSTRQQQNGIQWVLTGCKWKSELEERKMWNKKIHIRYLSANYLCRMNYSTLLFSVPRLCPLPPLLAVCLPACRYSRWFSRSAIYYYFWLRHKNINKGGTNWTGNCKLQEQEPKVSSLGHIYQHHAYLPRG